MITERPIVVLVREAVRIGQARLAGIPRGPPGLFLERSGAAASALFSGPTSNSTSTLMYRGLMGTTLYVGNLSDSATEEALRRVFGAGGRLVAWIIMPFDHKSGRPNGYAFVEMSTEEEARSAALEVDGTELEGRMLIVALLKPAADSRADA